MRNRTLLAAAGVHDLAGAPQPLRALIVEDGRIAWTGADPSDAPPHDREVDLGGSWVTPAFVDAHVHATATGLLSSGVDLRGSASLAEATARLRRHAADVDDPVLLGGGWDDFSWPEGRPPTADELADAAPGRTVHLVRVDAHSCVVDASTLARLPLASLQGVERDERGRPTGFLREQAAQAAFGAVRELLSASQLEAARGRVCADAAALGLGALHEMGHPGLHGLDDAIAWHEGDWPLDVTVWWAELDPHAPAGLRAGGDLFLDGSIGSGTAALCEPDASGGAGELFHDDAAVAEFFAEATARRSGAGVHAIGDRAVEQAVTALEKAVALHGVDAVAACRHRIEHAELASRDQVRRIAGLGVVASVQPAFDAEWGGPDGLYAGRFGQRRALASNPLAWFAEAGVAMAFGSDTPVTPFGPWAGVLAGERHRGGLGIGRLDALAAHTLGGRFVAGQDDVGPLAPGLRADFAVWDADPLALEDPTTARCLATVVRGVVVHGELAP